MARRLLPGALQPERWPVRWRLAGVSAALTFVILLLFALVVGGMAKDRLESDFRNKLELTATQLAAAVGVDPETGLRGIDRAVLDQIATAADAKIALVNAQGEGDVDAPPSLQHFELPPPRIGTVRVGDMEVVTRPVPPQFSASPFGGEPLFVQFARDHTELDKTIGRLWLLLGLGVLGGTAMATLAGLTVANRAMRPIAALTDTARKIASTRDPTLAMPRPQAEDEVAELARTLDSMLAELDAARAESQQMVQLQREFVADASHELRTPLTSILANLELLEERLGREGDEAEMVGSALRSSRRMRRLVGDLLMLARADAGRHGERLPHELGEIARAAIEEVHPLFGSHQLELSAPEPVWVNANADELHRLVVNLLENGARHTPPGTTVEVEVAGEDGHARLVVSDDGPGLPQGLEDQVFSRFVRGNGPADVSSDSGTGLGLAIVSAVANSHGGSVTAGRSERGGARFEVTIPAIEAPAEIHTEVSSGV